MKKLRGKDLIYIPYTKLITEWEWQVVRPSPHKLTFLKKKNFFLENVLHKDRMHEYQQNHMKLH